MKSVFTAIVVVFVLGFASSVQAGERRECRGGNCKVTEPVQRAVKATAHVGGAVKQSVVGLAKKVRPLRRRCNHC